jgi:hypothetical protein
MDGYGDTASGRSDLKVEEEKLKSHFARGEFDVYKYICDILKVIACDNSY